MTIAFLGDIHGCVRHALAATLALQANREGALRAVVQVGDFGAHRSTESFGPSDRHYLEQNPAQGDVLQALHPDAQLRAQLEEVSARIPPPGMMFLSGNHEDDHWLKELHERAGGAPVVPVDPSGVFHHVASGSTVTLADGTDLAFLGGCSAPGFPFDIPADGLAALLARPAGSIDVLVTHDGPRGLCTNWQGRTQGSGRITALLEHLQPRFHISGHYHHVSGPRLYGRTRSYMLAQLVAPKVDRWSGVEVNTAQRVSPGSIGVLDLEADSFTYVTEPWLAEVRGDEIDLTEHLERWRRC